MRLYIDDDSIARLLITLLRKEGHDVQVPAEAGLGGAPDARHLRHAIRERRLLLTGNHRDFLELHQLLVESGGRHWGMAIVRKDDDPRRDLTTRGITTALKKLIASGLPLENEFHILNHWR